MKRLGSRLGILVGTCALIMLVAAPARAQLGSLQGKVVDETGAAVADAEVTLKYSGEFNYNFTVKTNKEGLWTRAGLMSVGGRWTITATKDGKTGFLSNVEVPLNAAKRAEDIVIRKGGATPGGGMTDAEAAARNKQAAELKKLLDEVNAALASNNFDAAITKLTEATTKIEKCASCYARLGDVYVKQNEGAKAEEAYKQATVLDEKSVEAWESLAILYNSQKKFDLAGAASAKVLALQGTAGPADATSAYNAGVIFINQNKMVEAADMFAKAVQMNPKMADAHFQLGTTLLNQGKMAEAQKSFEQYLVLAPSGSNAAMATELVAELKKMPR
jgi:tetratricopeptide (TPR) repeat protein